MARLKKIDICLFLFVKVLANFRLPSELAEGAERLLAEPLGNHFLKAEIINLDPPFLRAENLMCLLQNSDH